MEMDTGPDAENLPVLLNVRKKHFNQIRQNDKKPKIKKNMEEFELWHFFRAQ